MQVGLGVVRPGVTAAQPLDRRPVAHHAAATASTPRKTHLLLVNCGRKISATATARNTTSEVT